jgi:predicted ArsR family transcriptional regulator
MSDETSMRDQIFEYIVNYKREHDGLSPLWQDIAEAVHISKATVRYHLLQLQVSGHIRLIKRHGIAVEGGAWDLVEDENAGGGDQESDDGNRPVE